jgi:hypothetical protein
MIDRHEGRIGDDVERLLASVVGMRPPADVGEQAGGMAQPPLLGVSSSPDDAMKRSVQSISSKPCSGERERSRLRSCAAAIRPSLRARAPAVRIEQPLAHAERRDHDLASAA